ncbi:MAG TPA: glutathione S-transferase family protein [Sphingobium sp.]|uniref:glutathione S-transferase family protein n=1 Tax=Sphingobium sp. TaxID=1912891 RepID=UPI002ED3A207
MLTVHHLASSQSERIVWLCEELELPYAFRRYDREPNGAAPPEYKALSPFETAPVITDGDLALGESGAIVDYICRVHAGGRLLPEPDHPEFADFLFWFHFANGSFIPAMMLDMFAKRTGAAAVPGRLDRALALIEQRLGEAHYFAGADFSAADIMMCLLRYAPKDADGRYPHIAAYVRRIIERPGSCRTLEKTAEDKPLPF